MNQLQTFAVKYDKSVKNLIDTYFMQTGRKVEYFRARKHQTAKSMKTKSRDRWYQFFSMNLDRYE